jgi:alpha-tubulin suppressor-like RCC1 family protein
MRNQTIRAGLTLCALILGASSAFGSGATKVTGGLEHTCAQTVGGGLVCWGRNVHSQLGDGTSTNRTGPVPVVGLTSGVAATSAGSSHTCALTSGGGVACWGYNSSGQLGDGTTMTRSTPTPVIDLASGVVAIAAGWEHTCALTTGGGVVCWGDNSFGQLGNGTTLPKHTPFPVSGLSSGVIAIAAGYKHTCAVMADGGVRCWGGNDSGQLGDDTKVTRKTPTEVHSLSTGVGAISAGSNYTCALTAVGSVMCWGGTAMDNWASARPGID